MWDVHVHLIPPDVVDAAERGHFGLRREGEWIVLDGERVPAEGRMIDFEGIDRYARQYGTSLILSVPPALLRKGRDPLWASFANDALASVKRSMTCEAEMLAILPFDDSEAAIREWDRVLPVCVGITVGGSIGARRLSNPRNARLWESIAARGGLALVHGGETHDSRLSDYYLANLVGYPYEDTVATADLVFSGLPLKHPSIQWCVSHGGGAAPFLLSRWQRGYETRRPGIDVTAPPPTAVYRELWFDSVVHDSRALQFLMEGAPDRVVFGTDYPFPMGTFWHLEENVLPEVMLKTLTANGDRLMECVRKG
ncbi:MAG: amidohydrolase [Firmicutes bacterium]|nr:amidohydrolase [Bacillota bacterium]